jgi:DNA-3-methyladenine glycosylase II
MASAELDLDPFYALAAEDPRLVPLVQRLRGLREPRTPEPFEALITAITEQLTSIKTAATIRARLVERYGQQLLLDGEPRWAFPTAEALAAADPADIRQLGLLGTKAQCIVALARAVTDGALDLDALRYAPLAEVQRALGAFRGIGPWTIAYALARGFGRYELVPDGDVALRAALGGADPAAALAAYKEWKGLAAFYLIVAYAIDRYRILQPPLTV